MKKILLSIFLLISASAFAQSDKAEAMYDEFIDLVHEGKFDNAAKKMKKLLGLKMMMEDRFDYTMQLGTLYLDSLGNMKEARKCFEAAHKMEEDLLEESLGNVNLAQLLAVHYNLGVLADSARSYSKMREISDCGLQLFDKVTAAKRMDSHAQNNLVQLRSMLYVNRAKAYGAQGKNDKAIADFDMAQSIVAQAINDPVGGNPHNYMLKWSYNVMETSFVSNVMNDKQKAAEVAKRMVTDVERAIRVDNEAFRKELEKQGPFFIYHIASACFDAGQYEDCLRYCNDGLTWPANAYAPLLQEKRGEALKKLNRTE